MPYRRVAYDLYFMASNINDLNEGFPYLNKALHLYQFRCEIIQTYSSIARDGFAEKWTFCIGTQLIYDKLFYDKIVLNGSQKVLSRF